MSDRCAVLGLLLIAALAWVLPTGRAALSDNRRDASAVIYARGSSGGPTDLIWSPESPTLPVRADGRRLDERGVLREPLGGWEGLLLGNALDLNRAGLEDLEAVPGIGPETASAIDRTRERLGGFRRVEDLLEVPGIGRGRLARLAPWVRVQAPGR